MRYTGGHQTSPFSGRTGMHEKSRVSCAIKYDCFKLDGSGKCRVKLQLHYAIYRLRFYSNSVIHILSLSNSHNNVASIQKNRGDKSHRVIVASGLGPQCPICAGMPLRIACKGTQEYG